MNRKQIFELKELAIHYGLFVHETTEEGLIVSFLEPIYVNETFLIKYDNDRCPICGGLLLHIRDEFQHMYDYYYICANMECEFNSEDVTCSCSCCECCNHTAETEITYGLILTPWEKFRMKMKKFINSLK